MEASLDEPAFMKYLEDEDMLDIALTTGQLRQLEGSDILYETHFNEAFERKDYIRASELA